MTNEIQIEAAQCPNELPLPRGWQFDLRWAESIENSIGWDQVTISCGKYGAGSEIRDFLVRVCQTSLEKIVIQNQFIRRIKAKDFEFQKFTATDVDWQMGNTWARLLDRAETVDVTYCPHLAPKPVADAFDFSLQFLRQGAAHAQELIAYIEYQKREEDRIQRLGEQEREAKSATSQRDKWNQIDINHSQVKEGFIYALENPLMPGVFKVGFTANNPDRRAQQISEQYGLPAAFSVRSFWRTQDPYIVEQRIHADLASFRRAGEFFECNLEDLCRIVDAQIRK